MEEPILKYVGKEATAQAKESAVNSIATQLKGGTSIIALVTQLQDWLISDDPEKRGQGTRLLAEVVQQAREALSAGDVHHLANFMSSRLSDWSCVEAAALGCCALLGQPATGVAGVGLTEEDGVLIVRMAFEEMSKDLQQCGVAHRTQGLKLLLQATQAWGAAAVRQGVSLAEGWVAAADGEKDPRCLLMAFQLLQDVAAVYHTAGLPSAPLEANASEMVEVLSCYFPISFTPPRNDPHKITREKLSSGLQGAMTASPFFARWVLPLVLEKMSSTHRPAKEDGLSALGACVARFGRDALADHFGAIWIGLRAELLAPSAYGLNGEDLSAARKHAQHAAECLTSCCHHLGLNSLDKAALDDPRINADLLTALAAPDGGVAMGGSSDPGRQDRYVLCVAQALRAVASGSDAACKRVVALMLPRLLALLPAADSPAAAWVGSTTALYILTVASAILQAAASVAASNASSSMAQAEAGGSAAVSADTPSTGPIPRQVLDALVLALVCVQAAVSTPSTSGAVAMDVDTAGPGTADMDRDQGSDNRPQLQIACIHVWQQLLDLHASTGQAALLPEQVQAGVLALWSWAIAKGLHEDAPQVSSVTARMAWGAAAVPADAARAVVVGLLQRGPGAMYELTKNTVLQELGTALQLTPGVASMQARAGAASDAADDSTWHRALGCAAAAGSVNGEVASVLLQQLAPSILAGMQAVHVPRQRLQGLLQLVAQHLATGMRGTGAAPVPQHSAAAAALATALVELPYSAAVQGEALEGAEGLPALAPDTPLLPLLHAASAAASRVTALACAEDQTGVALAACGVLALTHSQPSSVERAAAAVVACAIITSLKPGVLFPSGASNCSTGSSQVLEYLVGLTHRQQPDISAPGSEGAVAASLWPAVRYAAAVALGSVLNKWSGADSEEVAANALAQVQGSQGAVGELRAEQLPGMAWVARGLALKNSSAVQPLVCQVLDVLAQVTLPGDTASEAAAAAAVDAQRMAAAGAIFFPVLLASDEGASQSSIASAASPPYGVGLGKAWHCTTRVLWHQRTLVVCLDRLLSLLGSAPSTASLPALLIALGALAGSAPAPLLRAQLPRCLRVLLTSITALSDLSSRLTAGGAGHVSLLQQELWGSLLGAGGVIERVLCEVGAAGDELASSLAGLLEVHAEELVQGLCSMARLKGSAAVRECGLRCLALLVPEQTPPIPYHAMHPLRHLVVRCVTEALDDNKRAVRQAAARCRRLWAPK